MAKGKLRRKRAPRPVGVGIGSMGTYGKGGKLTYGGGRGGG